VKPFAKAVRIPKKPYATHMPCGVCPVHGKRRNKVIINGSGGRGNEFFTHIVSAAAVQAAATAAKK
jgi:hypothetical protein